MPYRALIGARSRAWDLGGFCRWVPSNYEEHAGVYSPFSYKQQRDDNLARARIFPLNALCIISNLLYTGVVSMLLMPRWLMRNCVFVVLFYFQLKSIVRPSSRIIFLLNLGIIAYLPIGE